MTSIQETISRLCPTATYEEGEILLVTVPDAQWHAVALALRDKLHFDTLAALFGVDRKETMGCMYYLNNSETNEMLSVRVDCPDRDDALLHSVADVWHVANFQEREAYDFYGIRFINHPDMRRMFLRNDWVGYPLRKDYDANPELNPIRLTDEEHEDDTFSIVEAADGTLHRIDGKVFAPDDYVVNIGPQHPSTHGVMRYRTAIDGETIKKVDVVSGYIHRGIEKLCEGMTYPQTLFFTDRMDYMSAHQNRHALCMCIEKALGIEVPRRAQVIRVMMDELMRISSHLLSYGCTTMDMGATTAFFYGFREREEILKIFEKTCGARMSLHYNVIGGVAKDLHPDFVEDVKRFCAAMPKHLKEYHKLYTGNVIAVGRMKGIGVLTKEDAISYAVTGPSGRASGVHCDCRKAHPYSIYNELDFNEVVDDNASGDSFMRYYLRLKEIEESVKILEQLVDNIPEGDICAKVPKIIKLPAGHWYQQVEASRGTFGVYIESDGGKNPLRMHFQSPCFNLVGVMDTCCRNYLIADLITIGATLDFVIPDIDR